MLFDDKSKGIAQAYLSMLEAKKQEPKMDPVGKHDADIDNDGDKDSSDEYLIKRRKAIATSMKKESTEQVDEASCGSPMPKAKKEAIEITIGGKSEVSKKGMKDKEGGDEEEDDEKDDMEDDDVEVKKKDGDSKKPTMKKESTVWNWDEILEASDEEIDALIEQLDGEDLESFVSEFNELSEMYKKAPPNETTVKTGKEKLEPRAAAEKAFVDMHSQVDKDHPFDKDQHDKGVKSQAAARPGDKRANEPMKSLKDIRK